MLSKTWKWILAALAAVFGIFALFSRRKSDTKAMRKQKRLQLTAERKRAALRVVRGELDERVRKADQKAAQEVRDATAGSDLASSINNDLDGAA